MPSGQPCSNVAARDDAVVIGIHGVLSILLQAYPTRYRWSMPGRGGELFKAFILLSSVEVRREDGKREREGQVSNAPAPACS